MDDAHRGEHDEDDIDCDRPSLSRLLASLALGARSVSSLPLAHEKKSSGISDNASDDDDDADDEFAFRLSLPEFAALNIDARSSLSSLLCRALQGVVTHTEDDYERGNDDVNDTAHDDDDDDHNNILEYEFDDPELWERCADACDALYERVSSYIASEQEMKSSGGGIDTALALSTLVDASNTARRNGIGAYGRMTSALVDMEKPQALYQGFVTRPVQNSRSEPFVPLIMHDDEKRRDFESRGGGKYKRDGHGLEKRDGLGGGDAGGTFMGDETRRLHAPDIMIAPSYHFDHPYREEIESLEYRPWQLDVSEIVSKDAEQIARDNAPPGDDGVWIATEDDLIKLVARINDSEEGIREIALDLEAHSYRTFAGYVCLIQLSLRRRSSDASSSSTTTPLDVFTGYDFLIDALALRHCLPTHLGPILANPNIVKVMHGADSDVPWLQRDFGCYIVNLFDTGRAARALKFSSAGLAFLLRKYVAFDADKAHQLSDWRRRPLPSDMRCYAISDTRYLLDIYDQLRLALVDAPTEDVTITSVLDRSKQVCLIRYNKEPFRPSGHRTIMDGNRNGGRRGRGNITSELSSDQEAALKALYDWRDRTARQEDESVHYVCPNAALLRIASNRPVTVAALQRLANPLPPLVMRRSQEILEAIKTSSIVASTSISRDTTNATKTTAAIKGPTPSRSREMLSPILGSDALYQQAGWMTPMLTAGNESSHGSSESDDDEGISQFLDINIANQGYSSTRYSSHSIEMSRPAIEEETGVINNQSSGGSFVDGLRSARVVGESSASIDEQMKVAQRSANIIKQGMTKLNELGKHGFSLMDLIRPITQSVDVDRDKDDDDIVDVNNDPVNDEDEVEVDEMVIPKSMREIYNLSNANRRTGKEKTTAALLRFSEDGAKEIQVFKEDDIEGADEIIGGYFDGGGGKRQKTPAGKEGDIKLMIKMGWVKDKMDAESLAVVQGDPQPLEKEVRGVQPQKKTNSVISGGTKGSGGVGGVSCDYYSTMGVGVGAFDPNASPTSKNPFFAGAAMSAASMLHGSDTKKPQKRNKKR